MARKPNQPANLPSVLCAHVELRGHDTRPRSEYAFVSIGFSYGLACARENTAAIVMIRRLLSNGEIGEGIFLQLVEDQDGPAEATAKVRCGASSK